jgi:uncharacterized protein YegJ (DUF2314 family)
MTENDVLWMAGDDPEMVKAYESAQKTFLEFARHAELEQNRVVPAFENVSVKAFFPIDPNRDASTETSVGEHMYVTDVSTDGKTVFGILNNDPHQIRWLKEGDSVSFPLSRLSDWFLIPSGNKAPMGGFTIDVLKHQMDPQELAEYEKYPPLMWFTHRVNTTALDDLKQLPVCKKCQKRDFVSSSYQDGVCGLCANGLARCKCQSCGGPLIRPTEAPRICKRCQAADSPSKAANPRERKKSSSVGQSGSAQEMGGLAKIYMVLVIAVLALVLLVLGFMLFDPAGGQAAGRTMMLGTGAVLVIALAGPLYWNWKQQRLVVGATVLQAIALVLTCIGLPVAVLGIVAMLQNKNE